MRTRALPLAMTALVACADGGRVTAPGERSPDVPQPQLTATTLRGTVDAEAGTLTFEPVPPVSAARLANIYGDQGVTVRLYNSPVTIFPSSQGKKRFSANVGIRNLLPVPIGDEQRGAFPLAIMGIHVFINSGPTVTATSAPCNPACTVEAQNYHGTLPFTASNQRYWHWDERVGAVGSGSDTTLARETWVFEADVQVTGFQFDVLVSAPWAPPNGTRWGLQYGGDSLPDLGAEPRWGLTNTSGTFRSSGGALNITTFNGGEIEFYRLDSVATTASAWGEARTRMNSTGENARAVIQFRDGVKYIALGIAPGRIGFISTAQNFPFIVSWATPTNTFRTYQLRKYAADSAVAYVDDVRVGAVAYSALSAAPFPAFITRFQFGSPQVAGTSNADWDYVIFEIGVPQP